MRGCEFRQTSFLPPFFSGGNLNGMSFMIRIREEGKRDPSRSPVSVVFPVYRPRVSLGCPGGVHRSRFLSFPHGSWDYYDEEEEEKQGNIWAKKLRINVLGRKYGEKLKERLFRVIKRKGRLQVEGGRTVWDRRSVGISLVSGRVTTTSADGEECLDS